MLNVSATRRIKSDTPRVDLPLSLPVPTGKNIGFHYVWTVAYPLPIDRRGHESKALLADHGYPPRFNTSCQGAAAGKNCAGWVSFITRSIIASGFRGCSAAGCA